VSGPTITEYLNQAAAPVFVTDPISATFSGPLPAGTNVIGGVTEATMDTRWGNATNIGTGAQGSSKLLAASGDTTVYTPADNTKKIRIRWFQIVASSNNTGPILVTVKFTATILWQFYLAPGAVWQRTAYRNSPNVNDTLVVNMDTSQSAAANYDVDEF